MYSRVLSFGAHKYVRHSCGSAFLYPFADSERENMIELTGKYNTAKVFAQTVEESALEQIREMCSMKEFEGEKIRIMPDVHSGKGCTIGTTMTVTDAAVPSFVGVDIGCGM